MLSIFIVSISFFFFFFSSRRRHTRFDCDWSSDVCSSDLRRRLARNYYDLVHAQFGHSGMLAYPRRFPLVVTSRGSDLLGEVGSGGRYPRVGRVLQRLSREVARHADAVIVVSGHMKAELPPRVPAHVIPSGLDFELFRPIPRDDARRHLGLPLDRHLVLFAGSPDWPRKRYALARQALDLLGRTLPAELVVAWGAPHSEIPYYMSACDALVFTRSEEHTSELQSQSNLVCRLLLEKKKNDTPAPEHERARQTSITAHNVHAEHTSPR